MKELLIFIMATSGLSWIVVKSKLFKSTRETLTSCYMTYRNNTGGVVVKAKCKIIWFLNEAVNCEGCFGFWSGILNSIAIYKQVNELTIIYGFAGSLVSLLAFALLKFLNKG